MLLRERECEYLKEQHNAAVVVVESQSHRNQYSDPLSTSTSRGSSEYFSDEELTQTINNMKEKRYAK